MLFSGYKLPFLISFVFACTQSSLFAQDVNATLDTNTSVNQTTIKPGRILGRVFDADSGEALKDVTVVLEDQNRETKTDLEGRYRLSDIAPGDYSLLFFKENYQRTRVKVEGVVSGRSKLVDLPLNPDYSNLETLDAFEITAEDLAGSDIQLLALRQESMVVMDAMGSFDMSRLGAGNVADALTKMVGTSVQDGKYVVVRGLADRYSNATFNGVPIPSSDVYRNTPQLDLFPSIAVDSISIKKSMSPELGAAFSGGSVDVVTKAYPEEFTLNVSAGTKFNELLFDQGQYLTYEDGKKDKYGFGLDSRKIPEEYESTAFWYLRKGKPTSYEKEKFMESVDSNFLPIYKDPELGRSYGIEFGNLFSTNEGDIGVLFSLDYSLDHTTKPQIFRQDFNPENLREIEGESSFVIEEGKQSAALGSYFQASIIPNEDNELGIISLWSHTGDKIAMYSQNLWQRGLNGESTNYDTTDSTGVEGFELAWEERDMLINQLYGKHFFPELNELELSWRAAKTDVSLDEPERKRIQRGWKLASTPTVYWGPAKGRSGSQFIDRIAPSQVWRSMEDSSSFYRFDLEIPQESNDNFDISFKFGISGDELERTFEQTELELLPSESNLNWWNNRDPNFYAGGDAKDFIFPGPQNNPTTGLDIQNYFNHPSYQNVLFYNAKVFGGDYRGVMNNDSFYFGTLVESEDGISLLLGLRSENYKAIVSPEADIETITPSQFVRENLASNRIKNINAAKAEINDDSFYPSISFNQKWENGLKFSTSAAKSTARPNFRELAYVPTQDPIKNSVFIGNPTLEPSEIENYDLRLDWSLSETDLISWSLFYKDILKPIQATKGHMNLIIMRDEVPLKFQQGSDTFVNSESAEVYGIEMEWKKGLADISEYLNGIRIGGNLTWSQSSVVLSELEKGLFPSNPSQESYKYLRVADRQERALEGQSEWIYTFDLSYSNEDWGTLSTLVYSYYDSRLHAAAFEYPDDLWEDGFSNLDFIHSHKFGKGMDWQIKFAAKNLTAEDRIVRIKGTSAVEEKYATSRVYSISLEKSF